jgi:molecular chaperone Hsp33
MGSTVRSLAADGAVRVLWVDALEVAVEAARVHGLRGGSAALCAEAVVAAALLGSHIKGDERITLQVQGESPQLAIYAEFRADGSARARLTPAVLGGGPGQSILGVLMVIKSDAVREVYRALTEVSHTSLEGALSHHLRDSEQVDAVLRISVALGADGAPLRASGALVERLPEALGRPSLDAASFGPLYGGVADEEADALFAGLARGELLGEPLEPLGTTPIVWRCTCSAAKVEAMLVGLGVAELDDMIATDGGASVTCHFCNTQHDFDRAALTALRDRAGRQVGEA